jgi:hypothetical protein
MVLPFLLSMGLPALASSGMLTGTLGTFLGGMSAPMLSGLGAGLGSFIQTGDLGEGLKTGLAAGLGAKVLGSMGGGGAGESTFVDKMATSTPITQNIPGTIDGSKFLQGLPTNVESLGGLNLQNAAAGAMQPGLLSGAYMGQVYSDASQMQDQMKNKKRDENPPPMPNPMIRTYNPDAEGDGTGEANYFSYQRPPRPEDYEPKYPYYYADGGLMGLRYMQEGGEAEIDEMMESNGMNEKDVIVEAIEAIKGMSEQPEIALAMFVQKYGEDALRDLVGRVQSGELDDTVARFEEGEKGMVRGPGDGSGVDDMVPATLEGEQDVLLSDGEFVLRKKTTDALEKAYGGGFLDIVNRAEEEAPKKLQQMVG